MNRAYPYRYPPFLVLTCGYSPLALPLGELSPQVTERVLQPFLNHKINSCTHATKIHVDIPVGESQNLQAKTLQELRTFSIISKPLGFIMLRSIHFNDQSGRSAVKVYNESADNPLFVNLHRIFAQKKDTRAYVRVVSFPCGAAGHFLIGCCLWVRSLFTLSVLAALGHLSHRERQGVLA